MDWHTYIRHNTRLRNPGDHRCGHTTATTGRPCRFPVPFDDVYCPVHYTEPDRPAVVVDLAAWRKHRARRDDLRRAGVAR